MAFTCKGYGFCSNLFGRSESGGGNNSKLNVLKSKQDCVLDVHKYRKPSLREWNTGKGNAIRKLPSCHIANNNVIVSLVNDFASLSIVVVGVNGLGIR